MTALSEKDLRQADYFSNRLRKNEKLLRKWARKEDVHALRLYDRDIPEIPLAVDRYGDEGKAALVIALYERPYIKDEAEEAQWLDLMANTAAEALSIAKERIFLKTRKRMKGLSQYDRNSDDKFETTIRESGLLFRVNLSDYLDTGLFLDHRQARSAVREASSGARVLNLFSYTGAFSIYAVSGGASQVLSVDLSNTYLAWSQDNYDLNKLADGTHKILKSDVMEYLSKSRNGDAVWDIIVVDPPTFSNSSMAMQDFDINRNWPTLLKLCGDILAPGGVILFSTNSRQLKWDDGATGLPS
ncbi:MAG TPA: class I SAM-dependent methyltransferase, partial [Rectinemataceae bacterium]|nr:class I SAM-dependent methyltransferase [Rectinemataceae bacterium]